MDNKNNTINDCTLAFSVNKNTPITKFLASLSDGRTVIQDDIPGHGNAWIRLSEWLKINPQIKITGLRLQGPNGIEIKTPANQNGYFFGYQQKGSWGGPQYNYIGIGYYDGNRVNIMWYRQPNFDCVIPEQRTLQKAGFLLIRNN